MIEKINNKYAIQLIEILNTDDILRDKLGSKKYIISKDEFVEHNNKWIEDTNSEIFAITLNDNAIGIISLSYQIAEEKKAQVGYWIGFFLYFSKPVLKHIEELISVFFIYSYKNIRLPMVK